jgi:AcrR family transcriptional regulator
VRSLVLAAAVKEFHDRGYRGATVQAICDTAGLAPSAVYQHFDGKSELFTHAVLGPFMGVLDAFSETWQVQRDHPWDERRLMTAWIELLYDVFDEQRTAVVEMAVAREQLDGAVLDQIRKLSTRMFLELRAIAEEEARSRQLFPVENVEVSMRLSVAMVAAIVIFDAWLAPNAEDPADRQRLIEQMADFALWGTTGRQAAADVAAGAGRADSD